MDTLQHAALSSTARQVLLLEKTCTAIANQIAALRKDGVPDLDMAGVIEAKEAIARDVKRWKRRIARDHKSVAAVAWSRGVLGLGDAVALFLGIVPPLNEFANVAKLWKYCGLAPSQGKGKGKESAYSWDAKSFAIVRLAEPCMKCKGSPYRATYDARRAQTFLTHPEWTDGHSHRDALRITAKAILRDLWAVENGRVPGEGHRPCGPQDLYAEPRALVS